MIFVACIVAASPMRLEPSHKSEMVSQLLFGEFAEVLQTQKEFTLIKTLHDQYEGWCQNIQLAELDPEVLRKKAFSYTSNRNDAILFKDTLIPLSSGTPIYRGKKIILGKNTYHYKLKGKINSEEGFNEEQLKETALSYLNVPYLWGGRSSFGIDCSGFTQQVFKTCGIALPRDAYQQATLGTDIGFLAEAQCGDLAFFDNEEGRIIHVGILLNDKEIIHASGCVRIDRIDTEGIINTGISRRTHHLRLIKRIV